MIILNEINRQEDFPSVHVRSLHFYIHFLKLYLSSTRQKLQQVLIHPKSCHPKSSNHQTTIILEKKKKLKRSLLEGIRRTVLDIKTIQNRGNIKCIILNWTTNMVKPQGYKMFRTSSVIPDLLATKPLSL